MKVYFIAFKLKHDANCCSSFCFITKATERSVDVYKLKQILHIQHFHSEHISSKVYLSNIWLRFCILTSSPCLQRVKYMNFSECFDVLTPHLAYIMKIGKVVIDFTLKLLDKSGMEILYIDGKIVLHATVCDFVHLKNKLMLQLCTLLIQTTESIHTSCKF